MRALFLALLMPVVGLWGQDSPPGPTPLLGLPLSARPKAPTQAEEAPRLLPRIQASLDKLDAEILTADGDRKTGLSGVRAVVERQRLALLRLQDALQSLSIVGGQTQSLADTLPELRRQKLGQRAAYEDEQKRVPLDPAATASWVRSEVSVARAKAGTDLESAQSELLALELEIKTVQRRIDDASQSLLKRPDEEFAARQLEADARARLVSLEGELAAISDPGTPVALQKLEETYALAMEAEAASAVKNYLGLPKDELLSAQLEKAQDERELANLRKRRLEHAVERLTKDVDLLSRREISLITADEASIEASLSEAMPHHRPFLTLKKRQYEWQRAAAKTRENREALRAKFVGSGDIALVRADLESLDLARQESVEALDDALSDPTVLQARVAEVQRDAQVVDRTLNQVEAFLLEARRGARQTAAEDRDLARVLETERGTAVAAAGPDRLRDYYIETSSWESLGKDLGVASQARGEEFRKSIEALSGRPAELRDLREQARSILKRLGPQLFWTRETSAITWDSVKRAAGDAQSLPRAAWAEILELRDRAIRYARDPANLPSLLWGGGLVLLFFVLGVVIHRRMPRTFSWLENYHRGKGGRLLRMAAAALRRTEIAFLVAAGYFALCLILRTSPRDQLGLSVLAFTPFLFRLGRVLLDLLFHPGKAEDRVAQFDGPVLSALHSTGRTLLWLSLAFVPTGILLEQAGYGQANPGFLELWDLVYQVGSFAVVLLGLFRPNLMLGLVRGRVGLGTTAKAFILVAVPTLALCILFLAVLKGLRLEVARREMRAAFFEAFLVLLAAFTVYRWLHSKWFKGIEDQLDERPSREDFDEPAAYMAAGRVYSLGLGRRALLRLLVFGPAAGLLWSLVLRIKDQALSPSAEASPWLRTIASGLIGFLVAAVSAYAIGHFRRLMRFVFLPGTKLDQGIQYAVLTLSTYVLVAIGTVATLRYLNVRGEQIGIVLGALSVGIGFGLQDIVKSFVAGIVLLLERPVKVGDQVNVGDQVGVVEKINLRSTTVTTFDNVGIIVPNDQLVGGTLSNRAAGNALVRTRLSVGVDYASDVKLAMRVMMEVMQNHGLVRKRPAPEVFFMAFGASSLDFELRYWTRVSDPTLRVSSDLRSMLLSAFRKHGISIPFNVLDVNLKQVDDRLHRVDLSGDSSPTRTTVSSSSERAIPEGPSE